MKSEILLATLNSRYSHAAFGLRYLFANLGELQARAEIVEFTIQQPPRVIADELIRRQPRILGFGVYIWNTTPTLEVVRLIKEAQPQIQIVLGGPEVSHEAEPQDICRRADFVIQGEADFLFRELCEKLLADGAPYATPPAPKFIRGPLPNIQDIIQPYALYSDADIKNRVIYVEASRGCPYKCEYCLSSLDKSVRAFPLEQFLAEMKSLIDRGVRQFKFVDRTFNLSIPTSQRIMEFFLAHVHLGLFLHFELVPDRLPAELRDLILKFPRGALQFEIGIQTWNPVVAAHVSRRQNYQKIKENLEFLSQRSGVHTHVDLIVGLPGETMESFALGFNEVAKLGADEIQVGLLKYLKGTPIARHRETFGMQYSETPPFTILQNKDFSPSQISTMTRFAKFWDLIANSGNFQSSTQRLREADSFFAAFLRLSEYLFTRHAQTYAIPLADLAQSVYRFWIDGLGLPEPEARTLLISDFTRAGRLRHLPVFLREVSLTGDKNPRRKKDTSGRPSATVARADHIPERQRRHLLATAAATATVATMVTVPTAARALHGQGT